MSLGGDKEGQHGVATLGGSRMSLTCLGAPLQGEAQDHPDGKHQSHAGTAGKDPLGLMT